MFLKSNVIIRMVEIIDCMGRKKFVYLLQLSTRKSDGIYSLLSILQNGDTFLYYNLFNNKEMYLNV